MTKLIAQVNDEKIRLDNFLYENNNQHTRSYYKNLITEHKVLVNGINVKAGYILKNNDIVEYEEFEPIPMKAEAENIKLDILYEDKDFVIVNKPKGMVVHPACGNWHGTMVNALLYSIKDLSSINGIVRPGIVHRLDKDTTGLIIVAKNDKSHVNLSEQIAKKTCKRFYIALVIGNLKDDNGVIQNYLIRDPRNRLRYCVSENDSGKFAETHFKVIKRYSGYTLVEFELKTGRTHQIRVHCKYMGHPIVGDLLYGGKCAIKVDTQLLHAYKLELEHPTTKEHLTFVADISEDFRKILIGLN